MDHFINDFISVWTVGALLVALMGGVLAGFVLSQAHSAVVSTRAVALRATAQAVMLGFIGSVYYAGRFGASLDSYPGRVAGGWMLWLVFCLFIGLGVFIDGEWTLRRVSLSVDRDGQPEDTGGTDSTPEADGAPRGSVGLGDGTTPGD